MAFYNGQRLVFDGHLCTVRYYGQLNNIKGEWLGVEWDDTSRGKHDGNYQGQQIFKCLSLSNTAASFIRPTRRSDTTRSLLDAIKHKYSGHLSSYGVNGSVNDDLIEISGKAVEEVGFQKIRQQLSVIADLKIVLVDQLKVCGLIQPDAGRPATSSAQQELARSCPNITELDLGWNPIETWQSIADISEALARLRILKASGLRLRSLEAISPPDARSPFHSIEELHLSDCFLAPDQILHLLSSNAISLFPALKTLWLSQNELGHFQTNFLSSIHPAVSSIVLENNKFENLDCCKDLISHFPNLTYLSLQDNLISSIGSSYGRSTISFPSIESLNLAGNKISDFSFVDSLSAIFPNLKSLRISKNPIYDQSTGAGGSAASTTHSSYYLTLARIPQLKILNYTDITARDREEGEIYYLSVAEKECKPFLTSTTNLQEVATLMKQKYLLYETLCTKYERESILSPSSRSQTTAKTDSQLTHAPGTLGSRLVNATFYIANTVINPPATLIAHPASRAAHPSKPIPSINNKSSLETETTDQTTTFTRPVPTTISVYTLKALLARHFHLPPLQFRLVYESTELDPVNESTMKSAAFGRKEDTWEDWGDWDVDIPPPATAATNSTANVTVTFNPHEVNGAQMNGNDRAVAAAAAAEEEEDIINGDEVNYDDDDDNHTVLKKGGKWIEGILHRNGKKWKRREMEILNGMRPWGDYLENDVRDVKIRIEPF